MKHFAIILFVLISLLSGTTYAQVESWDTYMAKFGNKPGSVLVDMGLMARAPDKRYQYLVITGPKAQTCDVHGFPAKEEIDHLEDILNTTDNFITGVTAKVLTGTFTYDCERLNYYYVKDTIGIRNAIMRLYNRGYKDYSYAINMKYDPEWVTYRTFLYPDEQTLEWMDNNKIIAKMMAQGDSLTTQRNINFDLFFGSDTDRSSFIDFAHAKGYKTKLPVTPQKPGQPFGLIVSQYGYVKTDSIQSTSAILKAEARKHHGIYSGWDAKK